MTLISRILLVRMGIIDDKKLDHVLTQFLSIPPPKHITISSIIKNPKGKQKYRFLLVIENNNTLLKYHNEVMKIKGFIKKEAQANYFDECLPIKKSTIQYVSNFDQYAFANYFPHITLGVGKNAPLLDVNSFTPVQAAFLLGNGCTCTQLLS